ncbi:ABC-three component system middle component 6 [Nocardia testacea]|uniref:ABC-three component system middle component 6 n=1 Tax=Nocardia testacea TaxID=248551 RepID=UPI0033F4EB24
MRTTGSIFRRPHWRYYVICLRYVTYSRCLPMLLPDKYVSVDRSLLGQSAKILRARGEEQTVSELWSLVSESDHSWTFDRFALALSLLFALGSVELKNGILGWSTS